MNQSQQPIAVTLLLKPDQRTRQGKETAERRCEELELLVVSASETAILLKVPAERFKSLFGKLPTWMEKREAGECDFGVPAGYEQEDSLAIPTQLEPLIEVASVEPPATRLQ